MFDSNEVEYQYPGSAQNLCDRWVAVPKERRGWVARLHREDFVCWGSTDLGACAPSFS